MSDFLKKYADLRGKDHVKRLQSEGKIAAQIKTERKKQGMSQQTLAEISGVPKSTIGRIEAGLTSPRVDTLMRLSKALNTAFEIDGTADDRDSKNLYVQLWRHCYLPPEAVFKGSPERLFSSGFQRSFKESPVANSV